MVEKSAELWVVFVILVVIVSLFSGIVVANNASVGSSNHNRVDVSEGEHDAKITSETVETSDLNLSERIDLLLKNGKLPFLFFYADWCGFCKRQKPIVTELEKDYVDTIEFIWVNAEDNRAEAHEFGVSGYPTMFLITDKGREGYYYTRIDGYTELEGLINKIETTINLQNINDEQSLYTEIDDFLKSGKPVFLFFYTDGCHFCHQQEPIIDELEREYREKITFIRLSSEAYPRLGDAFGVSEYPTMIVITDKGDSGYRYTKIKGYTMREALTAELDRALGETVLHTAVTSDSVSSSDSATLQGNVEPVRVSASKHCGGAVTCNCGDTVVSDYTLTADLNCGYGFSGLTVGANNIHINGDGHSLHGGGGEFTYGIQNQGYDYVTISNLSIYGFDIEIWFSTYANHNTITDNEIIGEIYVVDSDANDISNNYIHSSNGHGISLGGHSDLNTIYRNTISDNHKSGILISNSNNNEIIFNAVCHNLEEDITVTSGSGNDGDNYCDDITAGGNPITCSMSCSERGCVANAHPTTIFHCGDTVTESCRFNFDLYCNSDGLRVGANGITIDGAGYKVTGNHNYDGIENSGYDDGTIKDLTIRGFDYGIRLFNSANHNTITGVTVNYCDYYGIYLHSSNNNQLTPLTKIVPYPTPHKVTIPNQVTNNQVDGVRLLLADNNFIENSHIYSNNASGIHASYCEDNEIISNTIKDNVQHGVYLSMSSTNNTIKSNQILASTKNGIFLNASSNENVIEGNDINENIIDGIYVANSAYNTISGNNLTENKRGINLFNGYQNELTGNTANINDYGFYLGGKLSSGNSVNENTACGNRISDFYAVDIVGSGDDNTCTESDGWNDQGTTGCTYSCGTIIGICNSCSDCSAKLNGDYQVVLLQNDLIGGHQCINFQTNNTVFDCQGYDIDWGGTYPPEFSYGIGITNLSGNTIRNCRISNYETGIYMYTSNNINLINNTIFTNGCGIDLRGSSSNEISDNNITHNNNGVQLVGSSDSNYFTNNTLCKQKERDIIALNPTSGNTRSGNRCDKIYNWNNDNNDTWCDQICTGNQSTSCSSESEFRGALNGDFNYIELDKSLIVSGGLVINASHLTINCNNSAIVGNNESVGLLVENQLDVSITNCTIKNFGTGVSIRSSAHNKIWNNTITNNTIGMEVYTLSEAKAQENDIYNNGIEDNRLYGILLHDARENDVSYNLFKGNNHYSIMVSGNCNNSITNNYGKIGNIGVSPIMYQHDRNNGGSINGGWYSEVIYCNVHNATIKNIHINSVDKKNDGIIIINSGPIHIETCTVENSRGIYATNSYSLEITSSLVRNNINGIYIENSAASTIHNNDIQYNNESGIILSYVDSANLFGNIIKGNDYGIRLSYSDYANMSDNTVTLSNNTGVRVESSAVSTILHNTINENLNGIYAIDSNNLEISDNIVRSNTYGISMENAASSTIHDNDIQYNNESGILLYYADSANIYHNSIGGNNYGLIIRKSNYTNISANTVIANNLTGVNVENSEGTIILRNVIRHHKKYGLYFDYYATESAARHNEICYNDVYDIVNDGPIKVGENNTCSRSYYWFDSGHGGCKKSCPKCIPIMYNGDSNGKIDIVFMISNDYNNDWNLFYSDIENIIQQSFFADPSINASKTKFNFWYTPKQATVNTWFDSKCNCDVCDWYTPDKWNEDCPESSLGVILHRNNCRDYSLGDAFSSEGFSFGTCLHEAGHGIFKLADEYNDSRNGCGTYYFQPSPYANIFNSNSSCQAGSTNPGGCHKFTTCQGGWWTAQPYRTMMACTCIGYPTVTCQWGPDAVRQVNWTLDQYIDPPAEDKAIIGYFHYDGENIELTDSAIVYGGYPERIHEWDGLRLIFRNSRGGAVNNFTIGDPRYKDYDYPPGGELLDEVGFTVVFPFIDNIKTLEIYDVKTGLLVGTVDLSGTVRAFCNEHQDDPQCISYDFLAFDTGPGSYPSVAGTHNGSITPYQTITVQGVYIYPSAGTGGHGEYVRIYNTSGVIAEASWNGYVGDWHNLTFNNSFTLYANETYNYTIRTSSYPQIIHASSHNATGGVITCEEFVDVDGKRHENWIPAVRLS